MHRRTALFALAGAGALTALGRRAIASPPERGDDSSGLTGTAPTDQPPSLPQPELERMLRLAAVPSVALAMVEGTRVTTRMAGVRRAGEATPTSADTVYAAASLTKPVVAYTLLALAHDGVLSLDRPVADYLPLPNAGDARARTITARHLLSHSGGWRNWRNNMQQALTADFEPGSRWSYSGEGYFFLQRVLEKLTGRALGVLVRERVFQPLGMARSALALGEALEPHLAVGHNGRGEPVPAFGRPALLEMRRLVAARGGTIDDLTVEDAEQALRTADAALPVLPNFLVPNAAASLYTTITDFTRFLQHLCSARAAGGAAAAVVAQMFTPQVRGNDVIQWGLGLGLETTPRGVAGWQWGDNPGYKHFCFANPSAGTAMVVFTNGDRGARVYERVIRALTGEDRAAFLFL
jgi:CubicO group peptidase (beta-lactamase class C family)